MDDKYVKEIQQKYSYLINYQSDDVYDPIDPLTYVDSNGDSLLHIASSSGDIRTLKLLLDAGLEIDLLGDMGSTALHYAESGEVFEYLVSRGASQDVVNEFGRRPERK